MNRWQIALVVAALAPGAWFGWVLRGAPPKPDTVAHTKTNDDLTTSGKTSSTAAVDVAIREQTPPTSTKKHIKRYHPPVISCPSPETGTCVCPGPGPLAEEEHTETTTGPGTIATDIKGSATNSASTQARHQRQHEALQTETHEDPTRWDVAALAGTQALNPTKLQLGAEVTYRPTKHVHAGAFVLVPKDEPGETVVGVKAGVSF